VAIKLVRQLIQWINTSDFVVAHWLRAAREALLGEMPILAGGTALFAMIAVVPTLAAAVALYSVVADPARVETQLLGLTAVLPADVVGFLTDQLQQQAKRSNGELGIALAISTFLAILSARSAARAMIDTLNRAYRVRELRTPAKKLIVTIAMAGGTLVGVAMMFGVVVALPAIFALASLDDYAVIHWLRWPALMAVIFATLLALYRFAPSPRPITERHLWPGAGISTLLLVVVSVGLSQWVTRVATYNVVYGTFGSIIVVMLWFYLSTIAIVLGGFVNAELERHAGAPAPDRSMY
jgi:membrane protein